ncbi:MAG: hypothetical protein DRQ35_04000 [Gammaproteobacteria bacterium]|nr:MAG: hypothetical protein DRQ35_04000 [Gammaproteobacteria bacterium]
MHRIINNIEFNFLLFGFMANFVWEMLQMPFFTFSDKLSLSEINFACLQASIGDAFILVIMFWTLSGLLKLRLWIFRLTSYRIGLFLLIGIIITIIFEHLATGPLDRWVYGDLMPVLPLLGTGILPIIQWLIVPLFVLWLVRRQLK